MPDHPDVLIIGGGVIGLTTAYYLARERIPVTILDRGDFGKQASWAGAGIVPPGTPERARTPLDQLRAHSARLYPTLSGELRELTGIDNGYVRCGGLDFLGAGDEWAIDEWRSEAITFQALQEQELRRLEPALAPGLGTAYHFPGMAQVRNPRHVKALVASCARFGACLRPGCAVHELERRGERIVAVRTTMGRLSAHSFVVASGPWTDSLLEPLGQRPGIHPVRGQIALLNSGVPLVRAVILQGSHYLVPRLDGRVLVGSTEEDAGFYKRTTAGAISSLLAFAIGLVPDLVEVPLETCWAGLRPASQDGLPFLGSVLGVENLFVAAGHFRAGIQLSPATGLILKERLLEQPLTVPLDAFRLDRPPAPRQRAAFRS